MKKTYPTIFIFISCCISFHSQIYGFDENLLFETISADEISLNTRIYCLEKDSIGFIWLGTDYGLLRYDGYKAQRIECTNSTSASLLNTIGIEALSLSPDSVLWIGSEKGLFSLNLNSYKVEHIQFFTNDKVRAILYVSKDCLWIGTDEGLFRYNPSNQTRTHYNRINSGLSQNVIRTLYLDNDENLWVGTENELNLLQKNASTFLHFDLKGNYKPEIRNNLILTIQAVNKNSDTLFVGTETGLCLFNKKTFNHFNINQKNSELTNEVIKTLHLVNDSIVFLGTDRGLFRLNLLNKKIITYYHNPFNKYSIINNEIWRIFTDTDGSLWLATSNGLSKINFLKNPISYTAVVSEINNQIVGTRVADITIDTTGNLWVGSGIGLLYCQHTNSDNFQKTEWSSLLNIENINSIYIDQNNRKWIGSVAGLNIWDPKSKSMYTPVTMGGPAERVSANYISNIVKGPDNAVWIGTWGGGLYKANPVNSSSEIKLSYTADLSGYIVPGKDYIYALNDNTLSQFSFSKERVSKIPLPKQITIDGNLSALCVSNDNKLWLGGKNELVYYDILLDSFNIINMPIKQEFILTGLIADEDNNIWGASNNTLFKYNTKDKRFKYIPITNNFPLKKFILSPFRKQNDGSIFVCGYNGFLSFNPKTFWADELPGTTYITTVKTNDNPILPNQEINGSIITKKTVTNLPEIKLNYKDRNLTFEFSSFNYTNIKQEQYTVLLEGYEESWRILNAGINEIEYINLPPGKYTFKVKTYPGYEEATSLPVQIKMPVWASPPLLSGYILLLISIILFLFLQYHRNLKFKARVSLIQLEKEKNDVLIASKIKFYINISHELQNSISLIIDPVKQLINNTKEDTNNQNILKIIQRNAHFLKVYIDQLLNFRKIETGHTIDGIETNIELVSFSQDIIELYKNRLISKEITLVFNSRFNNFYIYSDEEKLFSILQNLLSNAVNFTPKGGNITFSLRYQSDKKILIEIRDSGPGIDPAEKEKIFERFYQSKNIKESKGTGIGLTIARDFAEIIGGVIELESQNGEGAMFRLVIPTELEPQQNSLNNSIRKEFVGNNDIITAKKIRNIELTETSDLPKVLLVDHNEDIFLYIDSLLKTKFHFIWANTGKEASKLIQQQYFDIIISEIQLPDCDGIKFCKKVRQNQKSSRIPFVFLTIKTEIENQLSAIDAGVDIFLTKPFEIEILEANITNLLRRIDRTNEFINRQLLINTKEGHLDSKEDKILKEVVNYITKNITNTQISAEEISYSMGISHSSLYRKIKSTTGMSLNEFVRHIRLQKAEKLLKNSSFSVSEIIFQVGFTNHSYFAKCFKKQFGKTPKDYAKQLQ